LQFENPPLSSWLFSSESGWLFSLVFGSLDGTILGNGFICALSAHPADIDILPYLWSFLVLLHACLLGNQYVKSGQAVDINLAAAYYIDFKILRRVGRIVQLLLFS
jgi:hypothetical protein